MRLSNLNYRAKFIRRLISLEPGMERQLNPYRLTKEISAFIRLGTKLLLALISENGDDLESVADHLVISCENPDDLQKLAREFAVMEHRLMKRHRACRNER